MSRLRFALGLLLAVLALAGCARRGTGPGPYRDAPVVLISIDTLRSDRLPAYGYRGVATPAIDALRAHGILFAHAYSHTPLTLPSHATLLTGVLPTEHGVRDNLGYSLDTKRHATLAQDLKSAGYATGAAISSLVLRPESGIGAGFDFYASSFRAEAGTTLDHVQRAGHETVAEALSWIRPRASQRFFFFLHLYEPHAPYEPPEPFASRYRDRYDGEVATADAAVGELLAELQRLGIYDRALVVLLSDHGEGLGEHGEEQHGLLLYRSTLQVPLLLKLPGNERRGETANEVAGLVDLVPTIEALLGLPPRSERRGTALLGLGEPAADRIHYAETFYPRLHYGWSELASAIRDRHHYIEAPQPELYDLAADPGEVRDLLASERRLAAGLHKELAPLLRPLAPRNQSVDPETAAQLAALGYLGGGGAVLQGALPDPKTQRAAREEFARGFRLFWSDEISSAAEIFGRLVAENPRMLDGWDLLAQSLEKLGRHDEAAAAYQRGLELTEGSPLWAAAAAKSLYAAGRFAEARQHAELAATGRVAVGWDLLTRIAALTAGPAAAEAVVARSVQAGLPAGELRRRAGLALSEEGHPGAALALLAPLAPSADSAVLVALGIALSDAGQQDEAARTLSRALERDPRSARAEETFGLVELRRGRLGEARSHLQRALDLDDHLPGAWNSLGVVRFRLEGAASACAAWERAVALDASQFDALFNLGLVAAESGRTDTARQALRRFVATAPPARYGPDIAKARALLGRLAG